MSRSRANLAYLEQHSDFPQGERWDVDQCLSALGRIERAERLSGQVHVLSGGEPDERMSVGDVNGPDGLAPGDQVILSDMFPYDRFDKITLK